METEKQYAKAFNNGYFLAAHEPRLLNAISQKLGPTSNYLEGFLNGKNQFELEAYKSRLNDLQKLRTLSYSKERDLDRGQR